MLCSGLRPSAVPAERRLGGSCTGTSSGPGEGRLSSRLRDAGLQLRGQRAVPCRYRGGPGAVQGTRGAEAFGGSRLRRRALMTSRTRKKRSDRARVTRGGSGQFLPGCPGSSIEHFLPGAERRPEGTAHCWHWRTREEAASG